MYVVANSAQDEGPRTCNACETCDVLTIKHVTYVSYVAYHQNIKHKTPPPPHYLAFRGFNFNFKTL